MNSGSPFGSFGGVSAMFIFHSFLDWAKIPAIIVIGVFEDALSAGGLRFVGFVPESWFEKPHNFWW